MKGFMIKLRGIGLVLRHRSWFIGVCANKETIIACSLSQKEAHDIATHITDKLVEELQGDVNVDDAIKLANGSVNK